MIAVAAVTGGIAIAAGAGPDSDEPITGPALEQASEAALAHTGGGRVTETEVGDEESLYEVEVTLPAGRQVDVQLDEGFRVVGQATDSDGPATATGTGADAARDAPARPGGRRQRPEPERGARSPRPVARWSRRARRHRPGVTAQQRKGERFRALHEGPAFVIPNPWDAGSARVLAALGFEALATTSSGFAFTLGRRDGRVTLDEVVAHVHVVDRATELPVSVDLENGYASSPAGVAEAIARVAAAGAVGASIEDFDPAEGIYPQAQAVERVVAAVGAARSLDVPFVLTARAENHIRGNPDLEDTIARLRAFQHAGADVLYAPGLRSADDVRAVCSAVSLPVNVLALPGLSLPDIAAAGARRISVGGGLAWVAVRAFADAATALRDEGDLSVLGVGPLPLDEWLGP